MRHEIAHPELRFENLLDLARFMPVARCDYKLDNDLIEMWKPEKKSKF
jgi:hypothetical protein